MGYTSDYGQDSRQTQGYGAYNSSLLYNMPQASAQGAVYDTSQQFPSRQTAGLQMLPTEVAAPYFPSEPTNAAAAAAAAAASLQPQTASSSASTVYQQNPGDQRVLQQSYQSAIAPMSGIAQAGGSDQVVEGQEYGVSEPAPASASAPDPQMGEAYEHYQTALRGVFTSIHDGALQTASESLLGISEWLLSKVVELGLTGDDENLHDDRLTLWRDFNHAWLSLCLKQKDMLEAGGSSRRGQNQGAMSKEQLTRMGNELVRLCNSIERHGLVDYEYGVWEERIIDMLHRCLDVYEGNRSGSSRRSSHRGS
ncbi:hypothetical protein ONZ43_g4544 [Nemania bipapillata]|uniref:Uncharacterized protein n=1 Tax=Nemania bipapillata TaxID=110536 RepID=A0ACC2ILA5_9PEZI|nr:hypothetical protein ONZ43_g4544 [Nemania bipapillata]